MSAKTNHDVFEAFANGDEASANSVRTERTESGDLALFSYSTPIALRFDGAVVVDDRRYSVTTSKQVTGTIMPCHRAGLAWDRVPHEDFRAMCRAAGVDLRYAR